MNNTERVTAHHREQFGNVPIERICAKLGEEAGEVFAEIISSLEDPDYFENNGEYLIKSEMMDLLVCLHALAGRFRFRLDEMSDEAVDRFCKRTWPGIEKVPNTEMWYPDVEVEVEPERNFEDLVDEIVATTGNDRFTVARIMKAAIDKPAPVVDIPVWLGDELYASRVLANLAYNLPADSETLEPFLQVADDE
jgi:hypothetical protein